MEVLVFKTSVQSLDNVRQLKPLLNKSAGRGKWNFALDDCDKILRVQSKKLNASQTVELLTQNGFTCIELED